MTIAELHREIARLVEENERLASMIDTLTTENADLKTRPTAEQKTWYTSREAAAFIGRSPAWLDKDRMLDKPTIPYTKHGYRTVRYHVTDLETYNARKLRRAA